MQTWAPKRHPTWHHFTGRVRREMSSQHTQKVDRNCSLVPENIKKLRREIELSDQILEQHRHSKLNNQTENIRSQKMEQNSQKFKGLTNGYGHGLDRSPFTNNHQSPFTNGLDSPPLANGIGHDSASSTSEHKQSLKHMLAKQVNNMEEDFKSALLQYFDEVDREKNHLIEELRRFQDGIHRNEVRNGEKHRTDEERNRLIKRLTSNGKVLVNEIEKLKLDIKKCRDKEHKVIAKNDKLTKEATFQRDTISQLEHDCKVLLEENAYLKLLAEDSRRLKEKESEVVNLENQVNFQQKMCKEYSLELADKDGDMQRLKEKCHELQNKVISTFRLSILGKSLQ